MNKPTRLISLAIAGVLAAICLAAVVLFFLVDPNRYRPLLEQTVAGQTGFDLQIAGDVSWSFRPVFGFSIDDVRLSNPAARQELASFSSVTLKLAPLKLLRGDLVMEEFIARDLHVNWYVDAQGQSNWFAGEQQPPAQTPQSSGLPVSVDIQRIEISNASLAVRDEQQGIDTRLENLQISSRNTRLDGRAFPLSVRTRLVDYSGQRDLQLTLDTRAQVDFNAGNAVLDELRFSLSPMVLSGRLAINGFHDAPSWEGELESNRFNLLYLLETLTGFDAGPGLDMDSNQLSVQASFNGDTRGATLTSATITLDDMEAELSGDILYAQQDRTPTVAYRVQTNALDLDAYLPPSTDTGAAEDTAGQTGDQQIPPEGNTAEDSGDDTLPFALLQDFNLRGSHQIASLTAGGLRFENLDAELTVENGLLDLQTRPVGFYGGELAARLQVNGAASPAQVDSRLTLTGINASDLAGEIWLLQPFTGRLDMDAEHSLRGDSVAALRDSITGLTSFSISDGSADITMIKRVFSAIAVLSPEGSMGRDWPDRVDFSELQGQQLFTDGLDSGQELALRMDNFNVTGNGGILLEENRFDYRLQFTILGEPAPQTIPLDERYRNIAWPVRCNAGFDSPPLQYCSPDLQEIREVFTQIAADEIERRARDAISEQMENLQERARGLLDRLRR